LSVIFWAMGVGDDFSHSSINGQSTIFVWMKSTIFDFYQNEYLLVLVQNDFAFDLTFIFFENFKLKNFFFNFFIFFFNIFFWNGIENLKKRGSKVEWSQSVSSSETFHENVLIFLRLENRNDLCNMKSSELLNVFP